MKVPAALAVIALAAGSAGCGGQRAAPPGGPVVLITLEALRADQIGGLGGPPRLTPNLAAFVRQADWAGRALAPSSLAAAAMASLFTGLSPWQHHVILEGDARLPDDLLTLPKAFGALGYHTAAFASGRWAAPDLGYARGFDDFDLAGRSREAAEHLAALDSTKQFVWVHILEPQPPWARRDWLLPRLAPPNGGPAPSDGGGGGEPGEHLPEAVSADEVELYSDGAAPLTPAMRRRLTAMYQLNVAWADEKIGRLFEALHASGQWDHALVAVTAAYGEELGEAGVIGHGGDLARGSLEVPLIVKLPGWCRRPVAARRDRRVPLASLWATLVEAAGGRVPPAMAASLFAPAPQGVLSELYFGNGSNLFSWVEGDDQLLWLSRFAPPEPGFAGARRAALSGAPPRAGGESLDVIASRLFDAFAATPPLDGKSSPRLVLRHWAADGADTRADDAPRAAALAGRLAARWHAFTGAEMPPSAEDREWIDQLPPTSPTSSAPPAGGGGAP